MATATATKPRTTRKPAAEKGERHDARDTLIDGLIAEMVKGNAPWQKDWDASSILALRPHNATTGVAYTGVNALWLTMLASMKGYESNGWATFKQMQALGGDVRGQKGTTCVIFKPFQPTDKSTGKPAVDDKGNPKTAGFFRAFTVFHESQITGATFPERSVPPAQPVHETVQRIVTNSGADVRYRGDEAFYIPGTNNITMPAREAFNSPEALAATLLHEMTHWTGDKSRLDRWKGNTADLRMSGADRPAEEVTAEMGAFLTCLALGIEYQHAQHAGYVRGWSDGDATIVKRATSAAKRASDMLLSYAA